MRHFQFVLCANREMKHWNISYCKLFHLTFAAMACINKLWIVNEDEGRRRRRRKINSLGPEWNASVPSLFASPACKHWFHFALVARTWLTCAAYSLLIARSHSTHTVAAGIINHNLLIVIYGVSKHYGKSKVYALRSVWMVSSWSSPSLLAVPCIEMKLHYFITSIYLFGTEKGKKKHWYRLNGRAQQKASDELSATRQAPSQWEENWSNCTPAKRRDELKVKKRNINNFFFCLPHFHEIDVKLLEFVHT